MPLHLTKKLSLLKLGEYFCPPNKQNLKGVPEGNIFKLNVTEAVIALKVLIGLLVPNKSIEDYNNIVYTFFSTLGSSNIQCLLELKDDPLCS